MKPSTFFAIFIPIISIIVITLYIIYTEKKKPDPRMIKVAYFLAAVGLLVFIIIFFGGYV
jgi:hypothetical protein